MNVSEPVSPGFRGRSAPTSASNMILPVPSGCVAIAQQCGRLSMFVIVAYTMSPAFRFKADPCMGVPVVVITTEI